jgi:hypothetical protein
MRLPSSNRPDVAGSSAAANSRGRRSESVVHCLPVRDRFNPPDPQMAPGVPATRRSVFAASDSLHGSAEPSVDDGSHMANSAL